MPPLTLAPHGDKRNGHGGSRQRQETTTAPAAMSRQRSASFHGSGAAEQRHQLQHKQRPKTLPDLLAGARAASFRSVSPPPRGGGEATGRRTPSKVLVSVAVQRSMWPLHVMASAEWTVADLVAAAVALYVKEGRRPLLPSADPAAFGLHYSQFSLESMFFPSLITCYFVSSVLLWLNCTALYSSAFVSHQSSFHASNMS
jgi:hypothetical protein